MSKTIETHLQSNEVRIPKKSNEFDVTGSSVAPCQYFKSSFARSLSFSQGPGGGPASGGGRGGGPYGGAEQHFTRSLDFDVNFDPIGSGGRGGGGGGGMVESDGGGTAAATMMMMMMMGTTPSSASPVYEEEGEGTVSRGESDPEPGCGMMNGGGGGGGIEASNGGIVKTLWNYAKGQVGRRRIMACGV
uniref:Uncharacterized protein n=1 Tax=Anopheles dirus TaxID=7168 RepID=A0A182NIG8_9DIPT